MYKLVASEIMAKTETEGKIQQLISIAACKMTWWFLYHAMTFQKNDDLEVAEIGTRQEIRVGGRSENVNKKYNNETATTQERKVHAIW